jgi:large subunit ribosomal protein L14
MINQGTLLRVIDNSGARFALCIKVLHKIPTGCAHLGEKVIIVVKVAKPHKKVKKGQIHTALIVRNSRQVYRKEGSYIKFDAAACVILKKDGMPLANYILGPVSKELRKMGHVKIISLSSIAL